MRRWIERRGKNSWRICIDLGRVAGRKKIIRRTIHGTKKDADQELRKLLVQLERSECIEPSRMTLKEYLETWLRDSAPQQVVESTVSNYRYLLTKHVIEDLGHVTLDRLQPLLIRELFAQKYREGKPSLNTLRKVHAVLGAALREAVDLGLLPINPVEKVPAPREERKERTIWQLEDLARFVDEAKDKPLYAFWMTILYTGLRPGEALALRWEDVDFENRVIYVRRALRRTEEGGRIASPKTPAAYRAVAFPLELVFILKRHRLEQKKIKLLQGPRYRDMNLIFASLAGTPIGPSNYRRAWYRILEELKLSRINPYALRHMHGTYVLDEGIDLKTVSARLGHTKLEHTARYLHHIRARDQVAAEALPRVLERARAKHKEDGVNTPGGRGSPLPVSGAPNLLPISEGDPRKSGGAEGI